MSDEWWFLRDGETIVWDGSPRWSAAIGSVVVGTAIIAGSLAAAAVVNAWLAVASLAGISIAGWQLLRVRQTSYLVTTNAIWAKRGVLGLKVRRVGLPQVQNTAYSQSVTGSVMGHGSVSVEVAGGRDVAFSRIDDPETVRRTVADRIGNAEPGVPGTVDQWRAIRDAVRDLKATVD